MIDVRCCTNSINNDNRFRSCSCATTTTASRSQYPATRRSDALRVHNNTSVRVRLRSVRYGPASIYDVPVRVIKIDRRPRFALGSWIADGCVYEIVTTRPSSLSVGRRTPRSIYQIPPDVYDVQTRGTSGRRSVRTARPASYRLMTDRYDYIEKKKKRSAVLFITFRSREISEL